MTAPATPANDAHTMTPAQRQLGYRLRRKRAVTDAIGEEDHASRVTLLALLGRDLAVLEDKAATSMHHALRSSAKRACASSSRVVPSTSKIDREGECNAIPTFFTNRRRATKMAP